MVSYGSSSAVFATIAERRILEAMEKGLFDNLPGEGKPLSPMEMEVPGNEMVNWVREWIKRERLRDSDIIKMRG